MYLIDNNAYPVHLPYTGTKEEILEIARKELIFTSTTTAVKRELSEEEILNHRDSYTVLKEGEEIDLKEAIDAQQSAVEAAKSQLKTLQNEHIAMMVKIDDHARAINQGFVVENLIAEDSIAITVDNHKLHYTYANGALELALVEPYEPNSGNLFESQDHNQTKFKELFGLEFSPNTSFEFVNTEDSEGRRAGCNISFQTTITCTDEESGEVIEIPRTEIVVSAGALITSVDVKQIQFRDIKRVIAYAETKSQAGEEKSLRTESK